MKIEDVLALTKAGFTKEEILKLATAETKPVETETKPVETETKPVETKPVETETKPVETETKPVVLDDIKNELSELKTVIQGLNIANTSGVNNNKDGAENALFGLLK